MPGTEDDDGLQRRIEKEKIEAVAHRVGIEKSVRPFRIRMLYSAATDMFIIFSEYLRRYKTVLDNDAGVLWARSL